ncbi:hypothetical protein Tco_1265298 [Tanacetum coccineum]
MTWFEQLETHLHDLYLLNSPYAVDAFKPAFRAILCEEQESDFQIEDGFIIWIMTRQEEKVNIREAFDAGIGLCYLGCHRKQIGTKPDNRIPSSSSGKILYHTSCGCRLSDSNDVSHFVRECRKMTQDKTKIPSHKDMASTRAHCTPKACTPKPRNIYRNSHVSKCSGEGQHSTSNSVQEFKEFKSDEHASKDVWTKLFRPRFVNLSLCLSDILLDHRQVDQLWHYLRGYDGQKENIPTHEPTRMR